MSLKACNVRFKDLVIGAKGIQVYAVMKEQNTFQLNSSTM
jgi:hypothetical protein